MMLSFPASQHSRGSAPSSSAGTVQLFLRVGAGLLALVLTVMLGVTHMLFGASDTAETRFAEGGTGEYHGMIDWVEWGGHDTVIQNGTVAESTRQIGGLTLTTRCTISDISGPGGLQA